jgi:hypothetical protein
MEYTDPQLFKDSITSIVDRLTNDYKTLQQTCEDTIKSLRKDITDKDERIRSLDTKVGKLELVASLEKQRNLELSAMYKESSRVLDLERREKESFIQKASSLELSLHKSQVEVLTVKKGAETAVAQSQSLLNYNESLSRKLKETEEVVQRMQEGERRLQGHVRDLTAERSKHTTAIFELERKLKVCIVCDTVL